MAIDSAASLSLGSREWYAIRLSLRRGYGEHIGALELKVHLSGHVGLVFGGLSSKRLVGEWVDSTIERASWFASFLNRNYCS
jgi:hypothetical protein